MDPVGEPVDLHVEGVTKAFLAGRPVLADVDLSVAAGTVVALLGPSGCGKTTLLRTIAGLETPDRGVVRVGDRLLTNGSKVVPPERRRIGMVFQDWALFPHLSVAANVAYGLPRRERKGPKVTEALELVGLADLASRLPGTLSGGQQQRVALARALAPQPSVMLFDEPFSNLDLALRLKVRSEVHRLLTDLGITSLFVTHDQEEAFVLGSEVAVMHYGRVIQQGPPSQVYDAPADPWVAAFVGDANLLAGVAADGVAHTSVGTLPLRDRAMEGDVDVLVRPEQLRIESGDHAVVDRIESYGHDCMLFVSLDDGPSVKVRVPGATALRRHDRVDVTANNGAALAFTRPQSAIPARTARPVAPAAR